MVKAVTGFTTASGEFHVTAERAEFAEATEELVNTLREKEYSVDVLKMIDDCDKPIMRYLVAKDMDQLERETSDGKGGVPSVPDST